MTRDIPHLKVAKKDAQRIKQWLLRQRVLNVRYKVQKEGNHVFFPLNSTEISALKESSFSVMLEWRTGIETASRRQSHVDLLKKRLPPDYHDQIPQSFDQLGNVIIVKLNDTLWAYRHVIGDAFLEWKPKVKAVYAKKARVGGEFRIIPLELIAGTDVDSVIVREHGLRLMVRFKEVFYNPRLANQHRRVTEAIPPHSFVLDAFSGMGPFSLHLASMKPCHVVTADINPIAIECLRESIKLNRRQLKGQIHPLVGDVTEIFLEQVQFDHVIMNLPELGYEFLPKMFRLVKDDGGLIHCHVFERIHDREPDKVVPSIVKQKVDSILHSRGLVGFELTHVRIVRDVAPGKYYLYFILTKMLTKNGAT